MALDTANIIEQLKGASILELNDLVHAIEEEFGVTAAAPVAAAGAAGGAEEAKSSFDVIKIVKEATGASLLDAKKTVDGAPVVLKEGLSEDEANELKAKLEEVGATVTLK